MRRRKRCWSSCAYNISVHLPITLPTDLSRSRNGRHNTTVHERVAPAIYHETISRHEHEELVTVIEKEFTQDHFHTSVQPITDSETAEEQHHHNNLPVEDRHFEHDDIDDRDSRLAAEREKFKDETYHVNGEHTQNVVPTVTGERIHHHVHEIIQPIVNKMTIEPHIIHSTVLIREIHHNASKHHILSALPAVTMAEFKRQGGVLVGREERWDSFEGEPRSVGGVLGTPHTATTGSAAANEYCHSPFITIGCTLTSPVNQPQASPSHPPPQPPNAALPSPNHNPNPNPNPNPAQTPTNPSQPPQRKP
ncbi:hypothetical protein BDY17DRAFT_249600 [Neohortaea acidophila]|uniref:Allergen n=1 Tax=Neohortaea acidophila TaxID=245834 RepID=A0A6A6PU20_9PEZI|nr:uncharacterized protein BDY17DRAFT_249600 [Neohortaea acidophila]KAF2483184.1 hypothetical protein BDY17DRAFT_249600 [Neohortaea acidophila]